MPKRATLTYTSEDAPTIEQGDLYVYYCKYSGKHAFTLDCDMKKLPKRRTDGARVVDTEQHAIKLYAVESGMKLIKRANGKIERQYRLNVGKLPVAYRAEMDGKLIYVMDNAVTTFNIKGDGKTGEKVLVPPCIYRGEGAKTEVRMEIDDRTPRTVLAKITVDAVRMHIMANAISHDAVQQEVVQYIGKVLKTRLTHLSLTRGENNRNKVLVVDNLSPEQVYLKLQSHIDKMAQQAEEKGKL